jgi:hypothetical protein
MMDSVVAVVAVVVRWVVVVQWAVAAVVCQADRSAGNRCLSLSNSRLLEHHLSLQHRLLIVHLLNNQSTHVWVAVGVPVVGM